MAVSVGKYMLLKRIAMGGMAEIFLAAMHGEAGFSRKVIIKKILPHYANEPEFVRRLVDEGLLASRLTHANIVQVLDLGRLGPDYFIAMEFVDGVDVRDILALLLDQDRVIALPVVLNLLLQVARGLAYAHDKKSARGESLNIVHRDISPANVLVSYEGAVKLTDFGIAKASQRLSSQTTTGILQGKFPYMSPEQTEGESLTQASDVFSFGVLAYELLTGKRPFDGDTDMQILARVKEAIYTPLNEVRDDLPEALCAVIHSCLEKDLSNRYSKGSEVERALAEVIHQAGYVLSDADIAAFLEELYGTQPRPLSALLEETSNQQEGEILEASPLDPYDLRAGMPNPTPVRTSGTRPPEFTRAVPQPDWRKRRYRRRLGWFLWIALMATALTLFVLDFTFFNIIFPAPQSGLENGPTKIVQGSFARDTAESRDSSPDIVLDNLSVAYDTRDILTDSLHDQSRKIQSQDKEVVGKIILDISNSEVLDLADTDIRSPKDSLHDSLSLTELTSLPDVIPDSTERDLRTEPPVELRRSSTTVSAMPTEAIVSINNRKLGVQPQTFILQEGQASRTIRIEHDGYKTVEFQLAYPGPRKIFKRLQQLPRGRLILRYLPASATVTVDGLPRQSTGGLNIIKVDLAVGSHTVVVSHDGRQEERIVDIEKDKEWRGTITVTP